MAYFTRWMVALFTLLQAGNAAAFAYDMQAQQVADNVYAIVAPTRDLPNPTNGGWNSNAAFVVTGDGVLLFDTGSSTEIGQAIRNTIATVTDQPVKWIVNSHAHGDHWLGNAAFADTVESISSSAEVADLIRNDGERWVSMFQEMTGGITGASSVVPPEQTIEEDQVTRLGGEEVHWLLSGGAHSPGDLMVWLPDRRVLISGDVVYSDRMPSTNAGNLRQWISRLEGLIDLSPAVVVPGHGAVTDGEGLRRLHLLLSSLWEAVQQGVDEGLSDYEMLPDVVAALSDFGPYYPGLDEKLKRDISHVYLQVEAASFE